jgi:hypothetical protein
MSVNICGINRNTFNSMIKEEVGKTTIRYEQTAQQPGDVCGGETM